MGVGFPDGLYDRLCPGALGGEDVLTTRCGHPIVGLQAAIPVAVLGRSCGVKRERQSRLAK